MRRGASTSTSTRLKFRQLEFRKPLAKYYIKWFEDCHESAIYCRERGDEQKAKEYLDNASSYLDVIMENWEECQR
jgi:hypothetical protein